MKNIMKTRLEMAAEFQLDVKTFSNILKKKEIRLMRGLICPADQLLIYRVLGKPDMSEPSGQNDG